MNGGSVGAQAKSSASRCLTPSAAAAAAPSVVVPDPEAPVMWMRLGVPDLGVVVIHPVQGALDRLFPAAIARLAGRCSHGWRPFGGLLPVGAQALGVRPVADGEA